MKNKCIMFTTTNKLIGAVIYSRQKHFSIYCIADQLAAALSMCNFAVWMWRGEKESPSCQHSPVPSLPTVPAPLLAARSTSAGGSQQAAWSTAASGFQLVARSTSTRGCQLVAQSMSASGSQSAAWSTSASGSQQTAWSTPANGSQLVSRSTPSSGPPVGSQG